MADLLRPSQAGESSRAWPWLLALVASLVAVAVEIAVDKTTAEPIFPFLFAAILVCAVWAGPKSSLVATVFLTFWAVIDLRYLHGRSVLNTTARCLLFCAEGVLVTAGTARLRRLAHESSRSEVWHRKLVETASEGIWVLDDKGMIVWANARMAGMLGISGSGLVGRSAEEFFFPSDLSVERIRRENLRNGLKEQFDRRLRRKDGSELWVLACCNLTNLEAGDDSVSLAMMTDITERKGAEHALRRSEERFRTLFENVLEGVYQSTPEGRILAANPMLLKMLGLESARDLDDLNIAKDLYVDRDIRKRLLDQLERDGGFQNVEYELRRRDGQIITVLENARVVRDEAGHVLYYEGTLTDISHKKRMEEQLRQAQKVEALGRLAGGIAHDFSNVLTVIAGYGELALGDLDATHPARARVEQVMQAVENAVSLTRQLISFSRRQASGQGGMDLNRAVEQCEAALQHSLSGDGDPRNRIRLIVSRAPELLPVYADQDQIDQILMSLSGSLREATRTMQKLCIKLELIQLDAEFCRRCPGARPGSCAVLSVFNPDIEMKSIASRVAEPVFAAVQPADAAALGLSAIHALISQGEGFMAIARTAGAPSAFHVFLPCTVLSIAGQGAEVAEQPAAGASGETILLVEDEPLVRELSRDMLERQGYRVILAGDAGEAERIGGHAAAFDLLITDTEMPNISGIELARRLRISHPGLKVLFIVGYADQQVENEEMAGFGAAFLQKPFSADSLGRKIRQVLNRS
jgi:PAS domain S-box-containing protein